MIPENEKGVRILTEMKKTILKAKHNKKPVRLSSFSTTDGGELYPADIAALGKGGVIQKESDPNNKQQFLYDWVGGEPSIEMAKTINAQERKRVKERRIKREQEKKAKKAAAQPNEIQFEETDTIVEPPKEVKATPKPKKETPKPKENKAEVVTNNKQNIPISVEITTEGEKKTLTIKIEI